MYDEILSAFFFIPVPLGHSVIYILRSFLNLQLFPIYKIQNDIKRRGHNFTALISPLPTITL